MHLLAIACGLLLIAIVLWDAFETVVLPRTVDRNVRLTRLFYKALWELLSSQARAARNGDQRRSLLDMFGPLSLLLLFGVWTVLLVVGFALLSWGLHLPLAITGQGAITGDPKDFGLYLYESGVTFFTLGYGDATPSTPAGRVLAVVEAGTGFGLLAVVIGYLPVIYQAFSRREAPPLLLDARAGSPPSAGELMRRHAQAGATEALLPLLTRYETWAAELLESFISYPVLAYYRAQHERLSWLIALTNVLDITAIIQAGLDERCPNGKALRWQAQLTFAMARHVLVDLAYLLHVPPEGTVPDRLPPKEWTRLCDVLESVNAPLSRDDATHQELNRLRAEYEPFVFGLAKFLILDVPAWNAQEGAHDSWQTTAWDNAPEISHF